MLEGTPTEKILEATDEALNMHNEENVKRNGMKMKLRNV